MRIVKPSFEILDMTGGFPEFLMNLVEVAGRVCYKSEDKITEGSDQKFIKSVLNRGHEAVIEHGVVTCSIVCDRGVTHEIVRHRLASYCQESTRYCNYSKDGFDNQITVIEPCYLEEGSTQYIIWEEACECAERAYMEMSELGCTPQEARAVLPNSLKTEIVATMNLREWRHFFKLRCAPAAHPQMREVAQMGLKLMYEALPIFFEDIYKEVFVK